MSIRFAAVTFVSFFLLSCGSFSALRAAVVATNHHANYVPLRMQFTSAELRGFSSSGESSLDRDESENLGHYLGEFFHDSDAQLVLDLDIFRELWTELDKFRASALEGDIDYVQTVIDFFR